MSSRLRDLAWQWTPSGSSKSGIKFVLLAICDVHQDKTGQCFPSVDHLMRKCAMSDRAVRGHIAELERLGLLTRAVKRGASTQYAIHADRIQARIDAARRVINAAESASSADHIPCLQAAESATQDRQNVPIQAAESAHITITQPKAVTKRSTRGTKSAGITFQKFLDRCDEADEEYIPGNHFVFDYAASIKLSREFVLIAWSEFEDRYAGNTVKRYADWRKTFANAVKGNWFKLWFMGDGGSWSLTTTGHQAKAFMRADGARAAA